MNRGKRLGEGMLLLAALVLLLGFSLLMANMQKPPRVTLQDVNTSYEAVLAASQVNINLADEAMLMRLPGIGEALAMRIIDYRDQIGGFTSKEELMMVSGIGEKKYASLQGHIRLD